MAHTAWRYLIVLAVVAACALPLAGCVVAGPGYYGYQVAPYGPPPPHHEVIGVAPYPGYIWIGGYWSWTDHDYYNWRPGHWQAPRPGYRWVPHHWEQHGQEWRGMRGHWQRH